LGKKGEPLRKYVETCLREERAARREQEREERAARREQEREIALIAAEKEKELALKRQELEAMHDIEMRKLTIEEEKVRNDRQARANALQEKETKHKLANRPKIPYFDDKTDDIESYLYRFDKHAVSLKWSSEDKALILPSLLRGRALNYYQELPVEDSNDYAKLSAHLLKRFRCTEEGFRTQFRSCKPESGETVHVFFSRLKRYFTRWTEMAEVGDDFKKLCDLLLREQILSSCSSSLVTFLKEGTYATAEAMIDAADRYREAHPSQNLAAKGSSDPLLANVGVPFSRGGQAGPNNRQGGRGAQGGSKFRGGHSDRPTTPADRVDKRPGAGDSNRGGRGGSQAGRGGGGGQNNQKKCWWCQDPTHRIADCPKKMQVSSVSIVTTEDSSSGESIASVGLSGRDELPDSIQTCEGTLNGSIVTVMLDSGCSTVGVRKSLVRDDQLTGKVQVCRQFSGDLVRLPIALVSLDTPYFSGTVEVCVIDNPVCDVILGRVEGCTFGCVEVANAVQTRAQKAREERPFRPLLTAKVPQLDVNAEKLSQLQREDASLQELFDKVGKGKDESSGCVVSFVLRDKLLYRKCYSKVKDEVVWQLVVPETLRESVLVTAHDGLFGGHLGANSTFKRVSAYFFWPSYRQFIKDYCRSCDICQKTFPKGRVPSAPLQTVPVIDIPFSRVCIDLIGPIKPVSARGHQYALVLVDVATRYPEAVPLKSTTTEAVAEALLGIFTRTGFPDEILSDLGTQFTSDVMREVMRLISVSQLHTTPYHPQTNGLCERFNGTLKSMLKKLMADRPKDWDRYLPFALFAYREIPQESTGYSPFELLYGRNPKGPTELLYHTWTDSCRESQQVPVSQYVQDLREILSDTIRRAQDAVQSVSKKNRRYRSQKPRSIEAGKKVLVLLPTEQNKMILRWRGPYQVIKKLNACDYVVEISPGVEKVYHVNMLREYVPRVEVDTQKPVIASLGVISGSSAVEEADIQKVKLQAVPTVQTETVDDVVYNPSLSMQAKQELQAVFQKHQEKMTDLPGTSDLVEHSVRIPEGSVVNVKQYPLPFESQKVVEEEVRKMLALDVIEPSVSPFSSPIVLVKKKDGSTRFCIDFRHLNKVTEFDAEPIPDPEVLFASLQSKQHFTKIDLAKGYWQIPMAESDRTKTAFRTPQGLYQFKKMPFGMSTAPSTFARMMKKLELDRFKSVHFFDDVLVATEDWSSHLRALDGLLTELGKHGLTVRPSKVEAGFDSIEFLGHIVGEGSMRPVPAKVSKILNVTVPTTKKQVRSLVGLVSFYRRYVSNFASIVSPLVELTKKNQPNKVRWSDECQRAFDLIKNVLSSEPVVRLPDFSRPFTVRSDASSTGIGAALMQSDDDGVLHPVLYASRKLLDRETRYSTVERECLALVWAVDKFHRYLFGSHFFVETDHRPLTYLKQSKTPNGRLLRWALSLQEYSFTVVPIAGVRNFEADVLSRLTK
jgi:transposase InsO family protein